MDKQHINDEKVRQLREACERLSGSMRLLADTYRMIGMALNAEAPPPPPVPKRSTVWPLLARAGATALLVVVVYLLAAAVRWLVHLPGWPGMVFAVAVLAGVCWMVWDLAGDFMGRKG